MAPVRGIHKTAGIRFMYTTRPAKVGVIYQGRFIPMTSTHGSDFADVPGQLEK